MKIAAIIAEYNPFHNGHQYLIKETRRLTGADYILAVMSGDFVQRGAPAVYNKYFRTQMALAGGADAVIELPSFYALSSAEAFASGSISLLNHLGVVDLLAFGSESGDLSLLTDAAKLLCTELLSSSNSLSALQKKGYSYPAARASVLKNAARSISFPSSSEAVDVNDAFASLFSSPNNILGIEYCKALRLSKSSIVPFTIKRAGSDYHCESLPADASMYGSASAIRRMLETSSLCTKQPSGCEDPSSSCDSFASSDAASSHIQDHVPKSTWTLLNDSHMLRHYLTADDFSSMLHYKLLCEKNCGFSGYLDCSPALSDKICRYLPEFTTISDFTLRLKSKDLTYTRISRVLFHILLNMTASDISKSFFVPVDKGEDCPSFENHFFTPYARLLGFRNDAAPLLTAIRKNSSIPLISKLADAAKKLDASAAEMLRQDIFCASVYEAAFYHKTGLPALNEFRQSPIRIN